MEAPASTEPFADLRIRDFVARLASGDPVPGGGSASAVAAALGAALVAMVAALSRDRPRYAAHAALHADAGKRGQALATRLLALADADAAAYARFAEAMKLPREEDAERRERDDAMHAAAREAAEIPLVTLEACLDVVAAAESLAGRSNRNAASDLNVATLLAEAAGRGAAANVLVNLPSLAGDDPFAADAERRVDELLVDIGRLTATTRAVVLSGESRDPVDPALAGRSG